MNIREDQRETVRYYAFLTIAKIFFVAVAFINPDIRTVLLLIIGIFFESWAEKIDHKIAQSKPQSLKDGVTYIFCGADSKNNFLFLEEHIHEEVLIYQNLHQDSTTSLVTMNDSETIKEIYDYDRPGIFNGVVFSKDLKIGDMVIKHKIEKDYVGIVKRDDFSTGVT